MLRCCSAPTTRTTHRNGDRIWESADALRGNQEPSEYKHIVLGLIFLKYISDRFEERRAAVEKSLSDPKSPDFIPNAERRAEFIEDRDEYTSHNVFWVPSDARWGYLQARGKLPSIGQDIDAAMDIIEKENPTVRGACPSMLISQKLTCGLLTRCVSDANDLPKKRSTFFVLTPRACGDR